MYNGAFAACPDPIDFRAYTLVNLYKDPNAYALKGEAAAVERPAFRNYLGEVFATQRDANYMELAQGDHSRSGGQYDIWQAVFGPAGADGYPKPIFDKRTGDIDAAVATYWKEHFDLAYIIERDWATLAPKLRGKIHLYVGNGDKLLPDGLGLLCAGAFGIASPPRTTGRSLTATAQSIAGMAIRRCRMRTRDCTITFSICRSSSRESPPPPRRARISRVGVIRRGSPSRR